MKKKIVKRLVTEPVAHNVQDSGSQVKVYTRGYLSWCGHNEANNFATCGYTYSANFNSEITSIAQTDNAVTITGTGFSTDTAKTRYGH